MEDVEGEARAWVLFTVGEGAHQYGGNPGYDDAPTSLYRYDSFVQNHLRLREGDLVLVRDRWAVLGSAIVESIDRTPSEKTRLSCPFCDATAIKERRTRAPRFRCRRGHVFDEPRSRSVACTAYAASFAGTFVPARDLLPATALKSAENRSSDQLSIRPIDPSRLPIAVREVLGLPTRGRGAYGSAVAGGPPYLFPTADTRALVLRAIRARQGQPGFRTALRERYGDACMITGCSMIEVVEAAHISPYRGASDNHPDNGLLLRADLHTLFDLDLLAIHPESLVVHLHPRVRGLGYGGIDGRALCLLGAERPSQAALRERWVRYLFGLPAHNGEEGVPHADGPAG